MYIWINNLIRHKIKILQKIAEKDKHDIIPLIATLIIIASVLIAIAGILNLFGIQ